MEISFTKMHGLGNDFIVVDDRSLQFPLSDTAWLHTILSRRVGIGCDGLILVQPPTTEGSQFTMSFFNPNGVPAAMCGNASRCVAKYARDRGISPVSEGEVVFDALAGRIRGRVLGDSDKGNVMIELTKPIGWRRNLKMSIDGRTVGCSFVIVGTPHAVVVLGDDEDLSTYPVEKMGAAIRYHDLFAPEGTNVNFVKVHSTHEVSVRTYERQLEYETYACGTGSTACVVESALQGHVTSPVRVTCLHGDTLDIGFQREGGEDNNFSLVTMTGPATYVFEGKTRYAAS